IRAILRKNFATFQGERQRERWRLALESARKRLETLEREDADGKARRSARRRVRALERDLAKLSPAEQYALEFEAKRRLLEELDYIRDGRLTARGEFEIGRAHVCTPVT